MPKKFRIGLIGAGGIAQTHMDCWQKRSDAEAVAIADISKAARVDTAARFGVSQDNLFEDYKEMLKQVELDAVDICTPNAAHMPATLAAFQAGCHVLVEKPVATSARQCERMIEAGHKADKLLMVAQVMRFAAESLAMRRWVDEGLMGDIYWARATYLRSRGTPGWGSFIDMAQSGGGPIYDIGVHVLDLCLHLMDFPEPVSVSASTYLAISDKPSLMAYNPRKYTVPEDFAVALIRFANGATISLETSWALNIAATQHSCLLVGDKGGMQSHPLTLVQEQGGMLINSTPQVNPYSDVQMFALEIDLFVEAMHTGTPSPVPAEQALITQRILDAIYKSGQKGKEVKV